MGTELPALDVEALTGTLRGRAIRQTFPLGPSILITAAERDAVIAALERAERLDAALRRIGAGRDRGAIIAREAMAALAPAPAEDDG